MVHLLDVNVLVALTWPRHEFHSLSQKWFAANANKGWATCPVVESGFVRVLSNPAFSPNIISVSEALAALRSTQMHSDHQFWPDDLQVADALTQFEARITGHRQVTDAYLLRLAIHHRGKLATLDKRISSWLGKGSPEHAHLEIIG